MNKHSKKNKHGHGHKAKHDHKSQHNHKIKKRPPHKDWRTWFVVVLMLAAMAGYVLTLDDSLRPGGNEEQAVPADAPGI